MPRLPQFRLRMALAFVAASAMLLASLRPDVPIGFTIAAMFVGTILSVRRLGQQASLWKASLVGSLGGALGGFLGGFVYGAKESWDEFSAFTKYASSQAIARGVGGMALGWVVGLFFVILMGMLLRRRCGDGGAK